jgi:hypothetical protein
MSVCLLLPQSIILHLFLLFKHHRTHCGIYTFFYHYGLMLLLLGLLVLSFYSRNKNNFPINTDPTPSSRMDTLKCCAYLLHVSLIIYCSTRIQRPSLLSVELKCLLATSSQPPGCPHFSNHFLILFQNTMQ